MIYQNVKYDELKTIPDIFKASVFNISSNHEKKQATYDSEFSSGFDHPSISNGFQQYFHADIIDMKILKEFKGRKKIYSVVHLFDEHVDEYESSIGNMTREYLKFKQSNEILGSDFYKMWEILSLFDLLNTEKSTSSLVLLDNNHSLLQSIMYHRNIFSNTSKTQKDNYITLTAADIDYNNFDSSFKKNISVIDIPEKVDSSKLYTHLMTKMKPFKNVDLVIGGDNAEWKYDIRLEQNMLHSFVFQIVCALNTLSDNGNFVCRIFETFTPIMNKLLYILSQCFDEIYITKPLMSHASTSEKFIVCKKVNRSQKYSEQLIKLLNKMDEQLDEHWYLVDVYSSLNIPNDFHIKMVASNMTLMNKQIIHMNKILTFINSQNYFGDIYINYKQNQMTTSEYWLNLYYPNSKEINKMIKIIKELFKNSIEISNTIISNTSKFITE